MKQLKVILIIGMLLSTGLSGQISIGIFFPCAGIISITLPL